MTDAELQERIAEMGVVRPGDTLVVRVERGITMQEFAEMRDRFEAMVPDVRFVVIAADQALIVQRDEAAQEDM